MLWIALFFGWIPVSGLYVWLFGTLEGKFSSVDNYPEDWDEGFHYN